MFYVCNSFQNVCRLLVREVRRACLAACGVIGCVRCASDHVLDSKERGISLSLVRRRAFASVRNWIQFAGKRSQVQTVVALSCDTLPLLSYSHYHTCKHVRELSQLFVRLPIVVKLPVNSLLIRFKVGLSTKYVYSGQTVHQKTFSRIRALHYL